MNAPTLVDWNQHLAIVIIYVVLLYGTAVVLIRHIAIAKGYDGRKWLVLALAFLPVAAVAVAALPVQDPEEPVQFPVTLPVTLPVKEVAAKTLVEGLYVIPPSTLMVSPAVVEAVSAKTT